MLFLAALTAREILSLAIFFETDLSDILNSERALNIVDGFKNKKTM